MRKINCSEHVIGQVVKGVAYSTPEGPGEAEEVTITFESGSTLTISSSEWISSIHFQEASI